MAVFQDGAGLTYTAASQEAVDKYAHMIRGYLGMTRDVGDRLKDVLAADGEMPMAVAAKGYFFLLFATGAMTARAKPPRRWKTWRRACLSRRGRMAICAPCNGPAPET